MAPRRPPSSTSRRRRRWRTVSTASRRTVSSPGRSTASACGSCVSSCNSERRPAPRRRRAAIPTHRCNWSTPSGSGGTSGSWSRPRGGTSTARPSSSGKRLGRRCRRCSPTCEGGRRMTTTGSRYLAEALQAYGLTHVFMVPTVAVTALAEMDSLGLVGVMAHGEKAAAYMAAGYARVSRAPGVCMAQTIGSANLAAGLRDAYMAGSPVLALTGGTHPLTRGRGVYQEVEDFPVYAPLTKSNVQLDDVRRLPDLLRQAFREAVSGAPGPVHVELQGLAGSVLDEPLEVDDIGRAVLAESRFAHVPPFRPAPEPDDVRRAAQLIERARRPVIVAGGGVRL